MSNWRQVGTFWAYIQLEMSPKVVKLGVLAELEGVLYADHVRFNASSLLRALIHRNKENNIFSNKDVGMGL